MLIGATMGNGMKNVVKAALLSSVITAALVYVAVEWRPFQSESSQRPPEVSWASSNTNEPATTAALAASLDDERNNIEVYKKASPGVVNISTTTLAPDFFLRPVERDSGTGSGAILDAEGHIATNFHVIENARRVEVTLWDKTKYEAGIVGYDPSSDLAVVKIDPKGHRLTPIPLAKTSKDLQVGQKVLAIGNPYGFLESTLTTGIISSLGRSIEARNGRIIEEIIQTDAAINPGNSGGPLLNSSGEIIGINTAIISPTGANVGIGFAIPADTVRRVVGDLITHGYVRRPYLGLPLRNVISLSEFGGLAERLGIEADSGLLVTEVTPGGPADRAGIRGANRRVVIGNYVVPVGGDVILAVGDRKVETVPELLAAIDRHKAGDRVNVTVLRNNRRMDIPVVLGETPRPSR